MIDCKWCAWDDTFGSEKGVAVTRMDSSLSWDVFGSTELVKYFHFTPSPIQSGKVTANNRHFF